MIHIFFCKLLCFLSISLVIGELRAEPALNYMPNPFLLWLEGSLSSRTLRGLAKSVSCPDRIQTCDRAVSDSNSVGLQ